MIGWLAAEAIELDDEPVLLEVAIVVTDRDIKSVAGSLSLAVAPSPQAEDRLRRRDLPAPILQSLFRSGLIDDCVRGGMALADVDRAMADLISRCDEPVRPVAERAPEVMAAISPLVRFRKGLVGAPIDLARLRGTVEEMGYDPSSYQSWDRPLRPMRVLRSQISEVTHINAWTMEELESPVFDILW